MATTADYLNKLIIQKNTLADNLTEKGVTASHDETLETLVPKVLDIEGGSSSSNISFSSNGLFMYPENMTIPSNVTSLSNSERCFKGHTELQTISVEPNSQLNGVTDYAFSNCTNLTKVDFSNVYDNTNRGRFILNNYAFQNCTNLSEIIFNEDTYIFLNNGNNAFANCKALTDDVANIVLEKASKGSVSMGSCGQMFNGCTSLKNIIISEGYTTIGTGSNNMFYNCTNLESVSFPSTLTAFNCGAFFGNCTKLKSITFNGILTFGTYITATNTNNPFYGLTALEEVILPEGWNLSICISTGVTNFTNVLTHDSMVSMFNNLATVETATLTLGETNLSRLTEEEKAIATGKGWTLA